MQLYRGLPIITNQIQPHEMNGIPHHLLALNDFAGPREETWQVGIFRRECLRVISEIRSRGKIPVIVGGTHYYIQSVLINEPLVDGRDNASSSDVDDQEMTTRASPAGDPKFAILDAPVEVMLDRLREVDPVMAARWHPKEDRKIRRSLEIYLQTGRKASDIYEDHQRMKQGLLQLQQEHLSSDMPEVKKQLRFPTLVFWVHSNTEVLKNRLNCRVGKMVEQGLLEEAKVLFDYLQEQTRNGIEVDRTRGIWVSIGFKELEPYFEAVRAAAQGARDEETLEKLQAECLEAVRASTRQYAKQQLKWIRGKLWNALSAANATQQLFVVNSTRPENWQHDVFEPAKRITGAFLCGGPRPDPKQVSAFARDTLVALVENRQSLSCDSPMLVQNVKCDACGVSVLSGNQWNKHVASSRHQKTVRAVAKREQLMRDNPHYRAAMATSQPSK